MESGESRVVNSAFFLINAPLVLIVCLAGHCPARHLYQPVSAKNPDEFGAPAFHTTLPTHL